MKKAFMLVILTLTSCGGVYETNNQPEQTTPVSSLITLSSPITVSSPLTVSQPTVSPLIAFSSLLSLSSLAVTFSVPPPINSSLTVSSAVPTNPSVTPVTNNTNTGSSLVQTDILAQYMPNPYHRNMMPSTVSLMGLDREDFLNLEVPPPPHEISPCYNAVMLSNTVPVMDPKYQYNGWWLMASLTNTKTFQIGKQPQLYWATQLTDTEVGAVPTDVTIPGLNEKLKTDYGMFPYYYVNRLDYISRFPVNPDEQCESLQR